MSDDRCVHYRCAGPDDYCAEATLRENAFADMVESGDFDNADVMAANIVRIVHAHLAENELRQERS